MFVVQVASTFLQQAMRVNVGQSKQFYKSNDSIELHFPFQSVCFV
jgi:hypothetical protein